LGYTRVYEKIEDRYQNTAIGNQFDTGKNEKIKGDIPMTGELEIIRGSGNIYLDFNRPDADVRQTKVLLASEIIGVLDRLNLSTRAASRLTGIDHSEFVRVRKPDLKRFTIDRLITILNLLDQRVDVTIRVSARTSPGASSSSPDA